MRTLKNKLYHGTGCENKDVILRDGLKISERESRWAEESEEKTDYHKLARTGVYLTGGIDAALYFGREASKFDEPCIFEIKCLPDGARIGSDGWGNKMTDKSIPPNCLRLLTMEEVAGRLKIDIRDLGEYIRELR
jgi:hypothetical protein